MDFFMASCMNTLFHQKVNDSVFVLIYYRMQISLVGRIDGMRFTAMCFYLLHCFGKMIGFRDNYRIFYLSAVA